MRCRSLLAGLSLGLLLHACAQTPPATTAIPSDDRAGLEAVINKGAEAALALLGPATLDRREGPARHLQFAGSPCILDLFYYPPESGGTAIALYADARLPDGRDLQAGECLARLQRAPAQPRAAVPAPRSR